MSKNLMCSLNKFFIRFFTTFFITCLFVSYIVPFYIEPPERNQAHAIAIVDDAFDIWLATVIVGAACTYVGVNGATMPKSWLDETYSEAWETLTEGQKENVKKVKSKAVEAQGKGVVYQLTSTDWVSYLMPLVQAIVRVINKDYSSAQSNRDPFVDSNVLRLDCTPCGDNDSIMKACESLRSCGIKYSINWSTFTAFTNRSIYPTAYSFVQNDSFPLACCTTVVDYSYVADGNWKNYRFVRNSYCSQSKDKFNVGFNLSNGSKCNSFNAENRGSLNDAFNFLLQIYNENFDQFKFAGLPASINIPSLNSDTLDFSKIYRLVGSGSLSYVPSITMGKINSVSGVIPMPNVGFPTNYAPPIGNVAVTFPGIASGTATTDIPMDKNPDDPKDDTKTKDYSGLLGGIIGILKDILDFLKGIPAAIFGAFKAMLQSILDSLNTCRDSICALPRILNEGWEKIIGAVGNVAGAVGRVLEVPLGGIRTAVDSVCSAVTDFNKAFADKMDFSVPEDSKLDFKPLYLPLTDRFPFCVPFDLINSIRGFVATPSSPSWTVTFPEQMNSVSFDVNLKDFDKVASIVRFFELLAFVVYLISKTRDIIRG